MDFKKILIWIFILYVVMALIDYFPGDGSIIESLLWPTKIYQGYLLYKAGYP